MKFTVSSENLFKYLTQMKGQEIPETVVRLVTIVKIDKVNKLEVKLYNLNEFLPKSLQLEQLKKEIFRINNKINIISSRYNFKREHECLELETNEIGIENNILRFCLEGLSIEEYQYYVNYKINEDDIYYLKKNDGYNYVKKSFEITLPKFELITDYLALLEYYDELIYDFNEIENGRERPTPQTRYQLQTKLTDTQRGKLFDLLVSNGFIPNKDKEGLIWAFGGVNDKYTSYSTEWLKNKNLAVYLIDSICIDNGRLWAIGSRIFDIKNMAQIKQNYFTTNKNGTPKGYELIDTIISEAQK